MNTKTRIHTLQRSAEVFWILNVFNGNFKDNSELSLDKVYFAKIISFFTYVLFEL